MEKFLHAIGFHQWSTWSEPKRGRARYRSYEGPAGPWEDTFIQERFCKICNRKELRAAS